MRKPVFMILCLDHVVHIVSCSKSYNISVSIHFRPLSAHQRNAIEWRFAAGPIVTCFYKMGWSAVCDCGISWSYSLTFFTGMLILTFISRQDSFSIEYWILFRTNPSISFFRMTGTCPNFSIISFALGTTPESVHGLGINSTSGAKNGGFVW